MFLLFFNYKTQCSIFYLLPYVALTLSLNFTQFFFYRYVPYEVAPAAFVATTVAATVAATNAFSYYNIYAIILLLSH